jgi:hypothetical protein
MFSNNGVGTCWRLPRKKESCCEPPSHSPLILLERSTDFMAERWPQRAIRFLLLVMSISTLVASSNVQPGPLLYTRSRMHKKMARSLDTRGLTGTTNITRRAVQKPPMTTTTESQFYHSHVQFAADAYCLGLQKGDKIGIDGTVLWETGNGNSVQMVYVAYSPSLGIVVGHQGTNTSSYASIANDLNFDLVKPFPELQWLGSGVMMSEGFQQAWNDTADQVLTQVKQARLMYPKARLVTTGHSLGASTALLSALHLHHALDIAIDNVVFGLPRTGNAEVSTEAVENMILSQINLCPFSLPMQSIKISPPAVTLLIIGTQYPMLPVNILAIDIHLEKFGLPMKMEPSSMTAWVKKTLNVLTASPYSGMKSMIILVLTLA